MPEVNHKDLKKYLDEHKKNPKGDQFAPVYLIFGEELLVKTAFEALLAFLLPVSKRSLNYTPFDGCVETSEIPVQDLMRIRATAQKEFNNVGLISGLKHRFVPRGPMMQVPEERFFSSVAPKQIMLEKAPVSDHHDEIMETV